MNKALAIKSTTALAAAALVLTGCSSSKSSGTSGGSGGGSSPSASSGSKPKIVYIPQSAGNAYFDPIGKGMQDACADACSVSVQGPSDSSASSQIPIIQAAVQNKVSAIAISANNVDAVTPALQQAKARHILIIAVNSPIAAGVADATINPTDFGTIGESMLKMMGELLPTGGKIDVLSATENAPGQTAWIKDMKAHAGQGDFAKLSIGETQFGNDDAAKSSQVMTAMLSKGDQNILAPTAAGLPAAAKVLSASPKKGKVVLSGLALPSSMKAYLADGTVKQFGLWNVPAEGWATAYLVKSILNGQVKATNGSYANQQFTYTPPAGSASSAPVTLRLDSTATANASPFVVFNSSNIQQYNF